MSNDQSSSSDAKNIRSVLEWAINPKQGSATSYLSQVDFQPLPTKVAAQSVKQILSIQVAMATVGGVAGRVPATPQAGSMGKPPLPRRALDFARRNEEHGWRSSAWIAVLLPLAALVFAVSVLAVKAWPAIRVNGWYFLYGRNWTYGNGYGAVVHTNGVAHPQGAQFGAWAIIWGTLVSSLIAIVIAVPLSIGAAFALTERMPTWISKPLGFTIEILAGIPSVVIGLWGILTFGPWLAKNVFPVIANNMPDVPVLRYFRQPVGTGEGLLTAGIVLALMIVPIIASTTRDLFQQVPPLPKEGASALGMTDWEVANKVTLPWVRSGIIGATVLGLGRALGETIAVVMIGGASLHIPPTIYLPFTTVAATILTQLDGALTDGTGFAVATLAELALVLAVISVGVNLVARHDHQADGTCGRSRRGRLMASTTLAGGPTTRRRRVSTVTWRVLTYLALVLIMAPAAWLLLGVLTRAWSHWQWSVLWTKLTPTGGGLRDQILGTLILMVGVFIIAGTIGVLAGIHLAEFTQPKKIGGRLGGPLRTASDILSGFPSIVLGYVGYVALVVGLHWGFSLRRGPHHPLHHGDPLHRQDDRELAAPGAHGLPGGRGRPRHVGRLRPAQGRAEERPAGHRHRAAPGPGHRLRRDGTPHLHGGVLQHAARTR